MKTIEDQIKLLERLIESAKERGNAGETEWIEFKTNIGESRCSITYDRVGDYISGLANAACIKDKPKAYLVLGVKDSSWDIVGTNLIMADTKWGNQDYELWLRRNTKPMIDFQIEEFDYKGKHIVIFEIPAALSQPVEFKKVEYVRVGSNLTKLSDFRDYKVKIYNSANDWSAQVIPNATIDDLDVKAIAKARELYTSKNSHLADEIPTWDDITFLNKAKITINGAITNTAILLLGKAESDAFISPSVAKIRWILKSSDDTEKDYLICSCPFVLNVETIYAKIRNTKYRYINPAFMSLFPEEIDTYDPYVIREFLHNAIAHQDYRLNSMISVVEFEDKLVFSNAGSFIPNSIKSVIIADSPEGKYRNPFLANAMVELKMVDTIGSGIKRVFRLQRQRLFPMPDFDFSDNRVKVTVIGRVLDENFSVLLSKNPNLSLVEIEILNRIIFKRQVSNTEIKLLRDKKMIEGRSPNVYISKNVSEVVGKQAEYTKNKGFDDKYYKDLILIAIKQHKQMTRKDIELLLIDKLSDVLTISQKKSKVGNLLTTLRKEEKIEIGTKKQWILSEL